LQKREDIVNKDTMRCGQGWNPSAGLSLRDCDYCEAMNRYDDELAALLDPVWENLKERAAPSDDGVALCDVSV
jgi:glutaredoxin